MGGSKELYRDNISFSKPLNTERTKINEAVQIATPIIEIKLT